MTYLLCPEPRWYNNTTAGARRPRRGRSVQTRSTARPPQSRGSRATRACRRRSAVHSGAAEPCPVLVELAPQLGNPPGAKPVLPGEVSGPFPQHEVVDKAAVAVRPRKPPGAEVHAEDDLLGHRRLRVVLQRLLPVRALLAGLR